MNRLTVLFSLLLVVSLTCMSFMSVNGDEPKPKKAVSLKADTQKSVVKWLAKKVTGQHNGTIKLSSGTLDVDNGKLQGGSFDIDMTTIVCEDLTDAEYNAKLIGHLKSDDFFSVEKHPKASFKITKVAPIAGAAAGQPNYNLTGDLTVKGIKQSVTFPAAVTINGNQAEAKAAFKLDRTKWDVKYGSANFFQGLGDKAIYDDFEIDLNLVANSTI